MLPRSLPGSFSQFQRPRKANSMTIAIGALYADGVIVAADSKVVFSDGSTTNTASKLFLSLSPEQAMMAIANAAEDGNAAKTVAEEISFSFTSSHRNGKDATPLLKKRMGAWF